MQRLFPGNEMGSKNPDYFKSVRHALAILKCFHPDEVELSGAAISRRIGMHRTSAYRILEVLNDEQFVERSEITGKYTVGPALYTLGNLYLSSKDLLHAARPVFQKLSNLTNEVVSMAILEEGNAVLILKEESRHPIRYSRPIGQIFPAYSTAMGRALLSELTDEEIDTIYPQEKLQPLTAKTVATKTELKAILEEIRATNVSFNIEGSIEGLEGIASLVRDSQGKAVAAISFAVPTFRMDQTKRTQFSTLIQMAAQLISYNIGYPVRPNTVRSTREIESWWEENQSQVTQQSQTLR